MPAPTGSVFPPKSVTSWFTSKGLGKTLDEATVTIPHDIYVFGTQENSMGDKEWVDFLRGALKDFTDIEYRPVGTPAPGGSGDHPESCIPRGQACRGGQLQGCCSFPECNAMQCWSGQEGALHAGKPSSLGLSDLPPF